MNHLKVKKIVINIFKNFKLKEAHAKVSAKYLIKAELLGAPSPVSYTHLTLPTKA